MREFVENINKIEEENNKKNVGVEERSKTARRIRSAPRQFRISGSTQE